METIVLKPGKEHSLKRYHPWVFSGAITHIDPALPDGSRVKVLSSKGDFLGLGHYQKGSIAVRIISFEDVNIDQGFWSKKIADALSTRHRIGLPATETNMFRLVHGEGDGLTGLVVDVYGDTAVIQPHDTGMTLAAEFITEAILDVCGGFIKNVLIKKPGHAADSQTVVAHGEAKDKYPAKEWGLSYELDLINGQKTGFFIDQRENRRILGNYSQGKRVLNTFCYNGGFSLTALKAGAEKVVSVDVSKPAIQQTIQNLMLNGFSDEKHPCIVADTFEFFAQNREVFDVMVLDPPAFAKHLSARHNALKGYQRLNATALRHIKPGGILFTFSCSQVVDKNLFYNAIVAAAIQANRQIKVLERLSQPADHPVSIYHPEGEYLKGLVLEVS